jgi:hypothetical protein
VFYLSENDYILLDDEEQEKSTRKKNVNTRIGAVEELADHGNNLHVVLAVTHDATLHPDVSLGFQGVSHLRPCHDHGLVGGNTIATARTVLGHSGKKNPISIKLGDCDAVFTTSALEIGKDLHLFFVPF